MREDLREKLNEYQKRIDELHSKIQEKKDNYVGELLDGCQQRFQDLDEHARNVILKGLDDLLDCFEDTIPQDTEVYAIPSREKKSYPFNFVRARRIRKSAGLTSTKLGELLGISGNIIIKYEIDSARPEHITSETRKYLGWLKEQGYNPRDL